MNNLAFFDIKNKKWEIINNSSDINVPPIRLAHSQCVVNDKIYIFGGRQGVQMGEGALHDLYYYDFLNRNWVGPIESKGGLYYYITNKYYYRYHIYFI